MPTIGDNSESDADLDRDVAACVRDRVRCTVRVRPLPNRCRLPDLLGLCPAALAARLPWNPARRRHKGVAFLEFASAQAAVKHAAALNGSRALGGSTGRELTTSLVSDPPPVNPAAYSRRRVVVQSLPPGRRAAVRRQLLELAPGAERVEFPGTSSGGRSAPAAVVVEFADARRALKAVRACQGAEVGGYRTSWMLEKVKGAAKPADQVDRRTLVLTGLSSAALSDPGQLHSLVPRCARLVRRGPSGSGGALAALYDTEAEAAADLAAWPPGAAAKAVYGHRRSGRRGPVEGFKVAAGRNSRDLRVLIAGLPPGTKKSQVAAAVDDASPPPRVSMSSDGRLAVATFASPEAATRGLARLRAASFDGKRARVARSLAELQRPSGKGRKQK